MNKKLKAIHAYLFTNELELDERLFRVVVLSSSVLSLIAMVENMMISDMLIVYISSIVTILVVSVSFIATFVYHRYQFAAICFALYLNTLLFPSTFFYNGGIEGGASLWLAAGLIYCFITFKGKRMIFFVTYTTIIDIAVYVLMIIFPEWIIYFDEPKDAITDSLFGVLVVGVIIGMIIYYQSYIFRRERSENIKVNEELEKANNSQNAFFANMSHEIRTPLNSIVGLNEMISRISDNADITEYSREINIASKMLISLINDILDMTQMELKKMEIINDRYQTKDTFTELIDIISIQAKAKKLMFLLDIDENIPASLVGDERRIKQIVLNLLTNAIKYTPSGSVTFSVKGEKNDEGKFVLIVSVSDTGIGIKKEDMEHLYETFKRFDSNNNKKVQGTGLGLPITKQLLNLMGGDISVDSIYTKGSTFTVTLPQEIADGSPMGTLSTLKPGKKTEKQQYLQSFEAPEAQILIVDDNRMNSMVESKLLAATKVSIDVANSGEMCLEMTKRKKYHVILMDYMMSGMDGIETFKRVRNQENGLCRETPVVVLTANSLNDTREICEKNNFDGYLEKPVVGEKIEKCILEFLPEEIVEYRLDKSGQSEAEESGPVSKIYNKRKKRIAITGECVMDLPRDILQKYDIDVINMYIQTPSGRFMDTKEIHSASLGQYVNEDGFLNAFPKVASVEEYQNFFADALAKAENVIHISLTSKFGKLYENAKSAAESFDHVTVIDSDTISAGLGMLEIIIAEFARNAKDVGEVLEEIERCKPKIYSRFLSSDSYSAATGRVLNRHIVSLIANTECKIAFGIKNGHTNIAINGFGSLKKNWRILIKREFGGYKRKKINTQRLIFTHANLSYAEQKFVLDEIDRYVDFDEIIVSRSSFTTASVVGNKAIGFSYIKK